MFPNLSPVFSYVDAFNDIYFRVAHLIQENPPGRLEHKMISLRPLEANEDPPVLVVFRGSRTNYTVYGECTFHYPSRSSQYSALFDAIYRKIEQQPPSHVIFRITEFNPNGNDMRICDLHGHWSSYEALDVPQSTFNYLMELSKDLQSRSEKVRLEKQIEYLQQKMYEKDNENAKFMQEIKYEVETLKRRNSTSNSDEKDIARIFQEVVSLKERNTNANPNEKDKEVARTVQEMKNQVDMLKQLNANANASEKEREIARIVKEIKYEEEMINRWNSNPDGQLREVLSMLEKLDTEDKRNAGG